MEIDLLEDRLNVRYLYNEGFTLYELYDIKTRLSQLEEIVSDMIKASSGLGDFFNEAIAEHHRHLGNICDNSIAVTKVIDYYEGKAFQNLGRFGELGLN